MAQTEKLMNEAIEKLRMKVRLRPIPVQHCTICYRDDHPTFACNNCGYCTEGGHFARDCPQTEGKKPVNERSDNRISAENSRIDYFLGPTKSGIGKPVKTLGLQPQLKN